MMLCLTLGSSSWQPVTSAVNIGGALPQFDGDRDWLR
jgi:hypothetical protein